MLILIEAYSLNHMICAPHRLEYISLALNHGAIAGLIREISRLSENKYVILNIFCVLY